MSRAAIEAYLAAIRLAVFTACGRVGYVDALMEPVDEPFVVGSDIYGERESTRWHLSVVVSRYWKNVGSSLPPHVQDPPPKVFSRIVRRGEVLPSPEQVAEMLFPAVTDQDKKTTVEK